ncbi:MAG: hypothetical protein R2873_24190 [Caldilineaceae bacterium]|nr:hypothetical protein [Caldilineaceae bacterium]
MTEEKQQIWEFVPLTKFTLPSSTTTEALRLNVVDMWRQFRQRLRQRSDEDDEAFADLDLHSAPDHLLNWMAPEPDWAAQGGESLHALLQPWLDADPEEAGVRTLVCPPPAVCRPMLIEWTRAHDLVLVDPPTPQQILQADERWFDQWPLDRSVRIVLPRLERCFLRHHNGTTLLRLLLERLWETRPPVVVLSESWAWAFLNRTLHVDSVFTHPVTIAAFDEDRLAHWLRRNAAQSSRQFVFRQSNNGRAVVDAKETPPEHDDKNEDRKRSSFLSDLATRSRGNPGVAWRIWRHSLQVSADDEIDKKAEESAEEDSGLTIWVRPWAKLTLPQLPPDAGKIEAFLLHALLIHGGMDDHLLVQLLPFSSTDVAHGLQRLNRAELIERNDDGWQIQALGYPTVRSFLNQEGFPLDGL